MHPAVLTTALLVQVALIVALVVLAIRARTFLVRALALEVVSLLFVACLALTAVREERAGYLDVGLVLALLGFAQTVAAARLVEQREVED